MGFAVEDTQIEREEYEHEQDEARVGPDFVVGARDRLLGERDEVEHVVPSTGVLSHGADSPAPRDRDATGQTGPALHRGMSRPARVGARWGLPGAQMQLS